METGISSQWVSLMEKKIVFLNESFKRTNRDRFPAFKNWLGAQVNMEIRNEQMIQFVNNLLRGACSFSSNNEESDVHKRI